MVPWLSSEPRLLPSAPSLATLQPLQAGSVQPTQILSLNLTSEAQASALSPCKHLQMSVSGWGAQGGGTDHLCKLLSILPSADWLVIIELSSVAPKLPFHPGWSPHQWEDFPGCGNVSAFITPPLGHRSRLNSFLALFFFLLYYLVTWRFSCYFGSLRSSASIQ